MTNKYNVQLITDVNGKPMPQYFDETEGVMKPITRDNGEVTGDINANVSFPETQNVNGTVSVDNFPQTQQVEVTNQKRSTGRQCNKSKNVSRRKQFSRITRCI